MWGYVDWVRTAQIDGHKVKEAREWAGLTQQQVAKKLGVNRATVAGWESEGPENKPGGPNFKRLCKVLRVDGKNLLVVPDEQAA